MIILKVSPKNPPLAVKWLAGRTAGENEVRVKKQKKKGC
jgi:hypothetical protein